MTQQEINLAELYLRSGGAAARELPSLGHNSQVEDPEQVWLLAIERL